MLIKTTLENWFTEWHPQAAQHRDDYMRGVEGSQWVDGCTWESATNYAMHGKEDLVSEAEALIDKLEDFSFETNKRVFRPNFRGAFPCVPAFLANDPRPMRDLMTVATDNAPITLYVSTTSSSGIGTDTIKQRGAAILALVLMLKRMRPVELYTLTELDLRRSQDIDGELHGNGYEGNYICAIRIETSPLNLGQTCFCLTSAGYGRLMMYALPHKWGYSGGWPAKYDEYQERLEPTNPKSTYALWLREYLSMTPQDLYLKPPHLDQLICQDPLAWLNQTLRECGAVCNG